MTKVYVDLPMDMHNVFRRCENGDRDMDRNAKAIVDHRIAPLIDKLSRKHPQWRFISQNYGMVSQTNDGHYVYKSYAVEEDGEELGAISLSVNWRTNAPVFEMDNKRLRAQRQRSGTTKTEKIDKAFKLIDTNYYGSTVGERMAQARSLAQTQVTNLERDARYTFERAINGASRQMAHYLIAHFDALTEVAALCDGAVRERVEKLPDSMAAFETAEAIHKAMQDGTGHTIMLWRDKMLTTVKDAQGADMISEMSYDAAPPYMAMSIGMLKLVGNKEVIPNIGMRVADNVFFVLPQGDTQ